MKNKYELLLLIFFSSVFSLNRHINNKNESSKRSIGVSDTVVSKKNSDCYCYKDHEIPKIFFDFIELSPVLCKEFIFYIIEKYAFDERKEILKIDFYNLFPEDIWRMLNSNKNFDCAFIKMIEDIYDEDEFILIYKTRMTIEFMIFAFNTKEKATKSQYAYFHDVELKKILSNLLDFANKANCLLEDKLSQQQIDEFKKFLNKYLSHKSINHMSFLNELKNFKYFLDVFFKEKGAPAPSLMQQLAMVTRFIAIFNK